MKDENARLPGQELVEAGMRDLAQGKMSENALVLLVAGPRLRQLGIHIPEHRLDEPFEHRLYTVLEQRFGTDAHSRYNSLLRRMASFASALEREKTRDESAFA